ncbi:hypothetical protein [Planctomicrobium piriforme]|uniref:Uncharacterized protein n=1 Tax=Planctomicrobium piriforme TaxID=1576369 RepID=A0A1I3CAV4_9PLAN|nr:hypothetical protein [Planctomicrobium piriforme]SFH71446.1 hypothetical protein SAMN05421753_102191 [Planctomicrobium piriforme]
MGTIRRVLNMQLGAASMDAWLSRWACIVTGACLPVLVLAILPKHGVAGSELVGALLASLLAAGLLWLFGNEAYRIHTLHNEQAIPWRLRRTELLAHFIGLPAVLIGGAVIVNAGGSIAWSMTVGMLLVAAYAGGLCLGCASTLSHMRVSEQQG